MGHQSERLSLSVEPRDDLSGVHPGLDDFQGYLSMNRAGLFSEPYLAHSTGTEALQEAIRTDHLRRPFCTVKVGDSLTRILLRFVNHEADGSA